MEKTYPLLTWIRNEILRSHSLPVKKITKSVREFCNVLMKYLYKYDWVGLAAPQIGVLERIIAVTFWKEWWEIREDIVHIGEEVMINPVITSRSKETYLFEEACLSVPGRKWNVLRHRHIKVQYQTSDGKSHEKKFSNMNAVIIQHEIDHLDGKLFVDQMVEEVFQ